MAARTLNIYSHGLEKNVTLTFAFSPPEPSRLYVDQFPVAWKVVTFRAKGHSKAIVKYAARHAFSESQLDQDHKIDPVMWEEVRPGQAVTLAGTRDSRTLTSDPSPSDSRLMVLKNRTSDRVSLSIGFVRGDGIDQRYEPTLFWSKIGANSNLNVQFTPVLSAYVTHDYQQTEVIRGEIETNPIWTQDLNMLDSVTGWNLTEDENGCFSLEPAGGP